MSFSGLIKIEGDTISQFYKTKQWKKKRLLILRRDDYLCRECRRYGRSTPANIVHHIKPLEDHPEFALSSENLCSLCSTCHEEIHDRATDELTSKGKNLLKRIFGNG